MESSRTCCASRIHFQSFFQPIGSFDNHHSGEESIGLATGLLDRQGSEKVKDLKRIALLLQSGFESLHGSGRLLLGEKEASEIQMGLWILWKVGNGLFEKSFRFLGLAG